MKLQKGKIVEIPQKKPVITYKKLSKNLKSPLYNFQYGLGQIHRNKKFDLNEEATCTTRFYSFLPQYGKKHEYLGDYRVFRCEIWGKIILEDNGQLGSEFIKIKDELPIRDALAFMTSGEAYAYCSHVSDIAIVRNHITEDRWIYNYCTLIRDDKTLAKNIKDPTILKWYNIEVKRNKKREEERQQQ